MHVSEGVLAAPVLATGAAVAATGVGIGLFKLSEDALPRVAVLSSAFFVASLIHVPVGVGNVHLLMIGLVGLILGWVAFPALLVALLLQCILFGFGGLTTLGVNTVTMALPAVAVYYAFGRMAPGARGTKAFILGFAAGAIAVLLSCTLFSAALLSGGSEFKALAGGVLLAHVPVMVIEGFVTGSAVSFLSKVRPRVFDGTASERRTHEGVSVG